MEVLLDLPTWVRDMGVFVTLLVFCMALIAYAPFAFRIQFQGQFLIGKNGKNIKEISAAADYEPKSDSYGK